MVSISPLLDLGLSEVVVVLANPYYKTNAL